MISKIILAGGKGFLGGLLAAYFQKRGHELVVLTRTPGRKSGQREVYWDGRTPGEWAQELEGAAAVINLAGRSVDCRYHARNRRLIMESRTDSTRALGEAIGLCARPPAAWLNASTATIYKHSLDRPMDEVEGVLGAAPEAKDAFSIEVATEWERVFDEANTPRTRKVAMRIAMVFADKPGTVYQVLRRLTRLGLGGRMGSGRQYVSWIHERDFCRAVEWLLEHETMEGAVNIAAPAPIPNREMMGLFRESCKMPIGLPAAEWMLELGAFFLRTETELVIKSRRVVPRRLLESGFDFRFPEMRGALEDLRGREGKGKTAIEQEDIEKENKKRDQCVVIKG